jgi:thymidine kinase
MGHTENDFLKSLGFPTLKVAPTFNHFDFTKEGRRVLIIGPMGSGKTEAAAKIWRDASVARQKSDVVAKQTSTNGVDRRNIFFIRSFIDKERFKNYPEDTLAYRSGYIACENNIAYIKNSFDLERIIKENQHIGTFIIDEASFFDERIAYVVQKEAVTRGLLFIFPTLILNFRRDIFNSTARLMLDIATDVVPLTAYCEHPDCLKEAFYTYRYYSVDKVEAPALYFDPLIIVGGDTFSENPDKPNYCARCDEHHYLPAKEYTFFTLKPLGEEASKGNTEPLTAELKALKNSVYKSKLYHSMKENKIYLNALKVDKLAEKALIYLFLEQNTINEDLLVRLTYYLDLDRHYMAKVLSDNLRPVAFEQPLLTTIE